MLPGFRTHARETAGPVPYLVVGGTKMLSLGQVADIFGTTPGAVHDRARRFYAAGRPPAGDPPGPPSAVPAPAPLFDSGRSDPAPRPKPP